MLQGIVQTFIFVCIKQKVFTLESDIHLGIFKSFLIHIDFYVMI